MTLLLLQIILVGASSVRRSDDDHTDSQGDGTMLHRSRGLVFGNIKRDERFILSLLVGFAVSKNEIEWKSREGGKFV